MEENHLLAAGVRRGGALYRTEGWWFFLVSFYCSPGLVARLFFCMNYAWTPFQAKVKGKLVQFIWRCLSVPQMPGSVKIWRWRWVIGPLLRSQTVKSKKDLFTEAFEAILEWVYCKRFVIVWSPSLRLLIPQEGCILRGISWVSSLFIFEDFELLIKF